MNKENSWKSMDLMPIEEGFYLGYAPDFENPYIVIEYDADLGEFLDYHDEITNWQELPTPPKVIIYKK